MLYLAGSSSSVSSLPEFAWMREEPSRVLGEAAACFRSVYVRHGNLSSAEQHYIGGWDNTGPNNLFYRLFLDDAFQKR